MEYESANGWVQIWQLFAENWAVILGAVGIIIVIGWTIIAVSEWIYMLWCVTRYHYVQLPNDFKMEKDKKS